MFSGRVAMPRSTPAALGGRRRCGAYARPTSPRRGDRRIAAHAQPDPVLPSLQRIGHYRQDRQVAAAGTPPGLGGRLHQVRAATDAPFSCAGLDAVAEQPRHAMHDKLVPHMSPEPGDPDAD